MSPSPVPGKHRALIVVDVQRDFCAGGALPARGCERVLPAINRYIAAAETLGMPIYASRDWHPSVTTHFKDYGGEWPRHCVEESPGAEFHPALRLPANTIVISKGDSPNRPGYSAFDGHTQGGLPFGQDLRSRHVDTLYVTGLATDYCVKQTTLDALIAGLRVVVLTNAIAGIDAHPGDVARALDEMSGAGANLTTGLAVMNAR